MHDVWHKLKGRLFHDWLVWIGIGPLCVLATATFALFALSPFHAIILLLSIFVQGLFWKGSLRFNAVAICAVMAFAVLCFPKEMQWWNVCWLLSLFSGLLISLFAIPEAKDVLESQVKRGDELARDRELWQSRFGTMKEKIEEDRRLWENEIELLRAEVEEKKSHVQSLKTLLEVIHRDAALAAKRIQELKDRQEPENFEIEGKVITKEEVGRIMNDLNFFRTQHYQVNLLLEEAKEKLKEQEVAIQARQKRNQSLLSTNAKKSISLKDLAKKV